MTEPQSVMIPDWMSRKTLEELDVMESVMLGHVESGKLSAADEANCALMLSVINAERKRRENAA